MEGEQRPKRKAGKRAEEQIQEQIEDDLKDEREEDTKRTERLKEKNKRAQKRFRERQKQRSSEQAEQLEQLQAQVAQLQARLAQAEDRCQLLERILSVRGDGSVPPPQPAAQAPQLQAPAPEAEPELFEPYRTLSPTLPRCEFALVSRGYLPGRVVQVRREAVMAMSFDEHVAVIREYVGMMQAELERIRPSLEATPHLQGLMMELFAWCAWLAVILPHVLPRLHRVRLDTGQPSARPSPAGVLAVLRANGLTQEQGAQMAAARRFCLTRLAELMRERQRAIAPLQGVLAGGSGWDNMLATRSTLTEAHTRLAGIVEAEAQCMHAFMAAALMRVLTPVQLALFTLHSYPHMPKVMGESGFLTLLAGEPEDVESPAEPMQPPLTPPEQQGSPYASSLAGLDTFSDEFWSAVLSG